MALFMSTTVLGLFLAIGLVVDGGRYLQAIEAATAAADAGAQAATTAIDVPATYASGGAPVLDPFAGADLGSAAIASFSRPGMTVTGSVTVSGNRATATATATADTVFLGLIGIGTVTGTGEGESVVDRGVTERWDTP